ncbi:MAG TPA: hypothetical protein VH351_09435 [Bryobacteraceae bacterium]|nr:hypothetical protein [Bryobacteraceae bacterium]
MRIRLSAFVLSLQVAFGAPHPKIYVKGDFEGRAPLNSWRVVPAAASPADTVQLTLAPGPNGQGAVLTYRIICPTTYPCADAASVVRDLPNKLPRNKALEICFRARFNSNVELSLITKDRAGHVLRFPIAPSIENRTAGRWQHVIVPVAGKGAAPEQPEHSQKPLVQIGFGIRPRAAGSVQGDFSFDDLVIRDSDPVVHLSGDMPVVPVPPDSREVAPLGVNIHLLRDYHSLDAAQKAGFQFARMDMLWANVERNGRYRFFAYDALVRALEDRKMGVLWILDYGHPDHGGKVPRTAEDVAAFSRFAEAAAAHFKGRNVRYEIWNEPDTAYFWPPSPNAVEYSALLREAIAAVHRADPSAKVSSGGVSKIDLPFLTHAVDRTLAGELSAISIHPYTEPGPEKVVWALAALQAWVCETLGTHTEIWNTEWGYPSTTLDRTVDDGHGDRGRTRQAVLAAREILTLWALELPLGVWYDLRDDGADPHNPDHNYGLLDSAGHEKPAMNAVRLLLNAAHGRNYVGMMQELPPDTHAMRLDAPSDTLFIVWSENPAARHIVEIAKTDFVSAVNLMGENLIPKTRSAGRIELPVDEAAGPMYVHLKREKHPEQ